jgi:hydrogenase maturation factor HypF (carbamoyltransferase family)
MTFSDSSGSDQPALSRRLVECFAGIATLIRDQTQINQVCLSGGTFHNAYLSRELEARLPTLDSRYSFSERFPLEMEA